MKGRWLHTWDTQMARPLESCDIPDDLIQLVILKLVIDAVRAYYNVIQSLWGIWHSYHIRYASHAVLNATKTWNFSLCISECAADWQSAWIYSIRAHKRIIFIIWVFDRWLLHFYLVNLISWHALLYDRLGLVDIAACFYESVELRGIRWFVVTRYLSWFRA